MLSLEPTNETPVGGTKLWLWKNGDHYLAFDNEYPTFDGGDPMTLGEPVGWAIFTPSVKGGHHPGNLSVSKLTMRV